jgi:3-hydroxybutyryl-CoA dehydrogenase
MSYALPADVDERPVVIDGAGTLGRRIAAMYAAGGSDVRIFDLSKEQREAARRYAIDHAEEFKQRLNLDAPRLGAVEASDELSAALRGAWMVIEAVPEKLELKRDDYRCADAQAAAVRVRALPRSARERRLHLQPHWAAIKRECLMVVEEGVARPEDVDRMWEIFTAPGIPPFRLMDRVGLDVVLNIEEHYAEVRPGIPEGPRKLLRQYLDGGRVASRAAVASTTIQVRAPSLGAGEAVRREAWRCGRPQGAA